MPVFGVALCLGIVEATTPRQLDDVRALFRAFVAWHRERHVEQVDLIDRYCDARKFEEELAGLSGEYAPLGASKARLR